MRIIGFGQQMRLDGKMRVQHEITVESDDGQHHVIPTDPETVQRLIELHALGKIAPVAERPAPVRRPSQFAIIGPDVVPPWEGEPDNGEVDPGELTGVGMMGPSTSGADELIEARESTPAPVVSRMPRPKFLEGDEDGNQI
jgi:hypothetical protein